MSHSAQTTTASTTATGPELCCFDLDGVLVDTRVIHWQALNLALAEHHLPTLTWDEHSRFDGLPTRIKLEALHAPLSASGTKQRYTRTLLADMPPDATKAALVEALKREGWVVAVVSNAVAETVSVCLERLGIVPDVVVSNEECHPKPSPSPYLLAMARAGVGPSMTTVIEDRPMGVESAVAAGVRTVIQVTGPDEVTLEHLGPDGGRWKALRRSGIHRP